MPFVRVNKSGSWSLWQQGLIAAINAGFDEPFQRTANLAANKGHNAIRLFLTYAGQGYRLVPRDYMTIGNSYVADPSGATGWDLPDLTAAGQYGSDPSSARTIAEVAGKLTTLLDECALVGLGVILTIEMWANATDRLWVDKAADVDSGVETGETLSGSPTPTTSAAVQAGLVNFWKATAAKFGSHPAIIGYDVLNEPQPASNRTAEWPPLALAVVNAIRAVDTVTPIVLEGCDFGSTKGLSVFQGTELVTSSADKKIVFSFHAYEPIGMSHNGIAEWAYEQMGVTYPVTGSLVNPTTNQFTSVITARDLVNTFYLTAVAFKELNRVPVFVGEFSYVDQAGADTLALSDVWPYYQPPEDNYSRQITSIEVDGNKVTLVMGNIELDKVYADRTGLGFRIDVDERTKEQLLAASINPPGNGGLTNTVAVTIDKVTPELRDLSGTPALTEADYTGAAGFDAIVTALKAGFLNQEATIKRGEHKYVITLAAAPTGLAASGIPTQPAVLSGSDVLRYPAVATLSLAPSSAHWPRQELSRAIFAKHVLTMCQDYGFSWAWHSVSTGREQHWWRPTHLIHTLLRNAASGRKMLP